MQAREPHADARCGAKTRTGAHCVNYPVRGRTRCRMHGGLSPRGIASPHLRTGRYSRDLPTRMVERYQDMVSDPDLLRLGDDIRLVDARIADVLRRVDTGESGRLWALTGQRCGALRDAMLSGDAGATRQALTDLEQVINQGIADWAAWDDVGRWQDRRSRLVATEIKRLDAGQRSITAEQFLLFVGAITAIIKEHVPDRKARQLIADAMTPYLDDGGPRGD